MIFFVLMVQYLPRINSFFTFRTVFNMAIDKKRVLIVDDEEDLTWSISRRLAKDGDSLEVLCTNTGNNALELLTQFKVDLLVTDLRMPGIGGLQLLNEVKVKYPHTHVIVMTAYGSIEVKQVLDRWGSTGYIEKPFEMNDLRNLIYTYLTEQECV